MCERFYFYAIWMRLHPDFNANTFGRYVILSVKKVTGPQVRRCPYAYDYLEFYFFSQRIELT